MPRRRPSRPPTVPQRASGSHEQQHATLAQRVGGHRRAGLGPGCSHRRSSIRASHQRVLEPQPQLVERDGLDAEVGMAAELLEGLTAPQAERPAGSPYHLVAAPGPPARRPSAEPSTRRARPSPSVSTYPAPCRTRRSTGRTQVSARDGRHGCTAPAAASSGGASGHSASTRRSTPTTRPRAIARVASRTRRRAPGTCTCSPSTRSASGPEDPHPHPGDTGSGSMRSQCAAAGARLRGRPAPRRDPGAVAVETHGVDQACGLRCLGLERRHLAAQRGAVEDQP